MNKEDEVRLFFEYDYKNNSININAVSRKCEKVGYLQKYFCDNIQNVSEKELKDIKVIQKNLIKKVYDKHKNMTSDIDQKIYDYCFENNSSFCSTAEFIITNRKAIINLLVNQI